MHLSEGAQGFVRSKRQEGTGVALPGTTGSPAGLPVKYQPFLRDEIPEQHHER